MSVMGDLVQEQWKEDLPRRKKARVSSTDAGTSAAPTGEADEGVELPQAPCKQCVCYLAFGGPVCQTGKKNWN